MPFLINSCQSEREADREREKEYGLMPEVIPLCISCYGLVFRFCSSPCTYSNPFFNLLCYAPKDQSQFLVCEDLLGNKHDFDSFLGKSYR